MKFLRSFDGRLYCKVMHAGFSPFILILVYYFLYLLIYFSALFSLIFLYVSIQFLAQQVKQSFPQEAPCSDPVLIKPPGLPAFITHSTQTHWPLPILHASLDHLLLRALLCFSLWKIFSSPVFRGTRCLHSGLLKGHIICFSSVHLKPPF